MVSSSRLSRFMLSETIFHQLVQLGFLDVSAGKVPGQVGTAIGMYFSARQLPKLRVYGGIKFQWLSIIVWDCCLGSLSRKDCRWAIWLPNSLTRR